MALLAPVTCRARRDGAAADNIIPLSWVSISIGKQKYSARVIGERKEFGLCVAPVELMESVDCCGYAHGDLTDKFAMTGLTKAAAVKIDAPLIFKFPRCEVSLTGRAYRRIVVAQST